MRIRLPGRRSVAIHAFPSSDVHFAADVQAAAAEARTQVADAATLRDRVEQVLRERYRHARVIVQDDVAMLMRDDSVWYAYRDGTVRPLDARRERFYSARHRARASDPATEADGEHRDDGAIAAPDTPPARDPAPRHRADRPPEA